MKYPHLKDKKLWIASDPGVTGGAAILSEDGDLIFIKSIVPLSGYAAEVNGLTFEDAMIEDLGGIPGDSPNTAFRLGTSFGIWQAQLYLIRTTIKFVRPQRWQVRFARQCGARYCPKIRKERKRWIRDQVRLKLPEEQRKQITIELGDAAAMAWCLREGLFDDVTD